MPNESTKFIIVGLEIPGLSLAAFLAINNYSCTLFSEDSKKVASAKLFLSKHLNEAAMSLVYFHSTDLNELAIEDHYVVDNTTWSNGELINKLYTANKNIAAGWIGMAPSRIEHWLYNDNAAGLIFFDDYKNYPFAEIVGNHESNASVYLITILQKIGCFCISTYHDRYFSLAAGLQFHYLALWQAHIHKIKPFELEQLLGRSTGFLPIGIINSFLDNPYLKLLHQNEDQLQTILKRYKYLANLKHAHLQRQVSRIKRLKPKATLTAIKKEPEADERLKKLLLLENHQGEFSRYFFYQVFQGASYLIKDFNLSIDKVDAVYKYAWQWPRGPFELWNKWLLGHVLPEMEALDLAPAEWVYRLNQSNRHFYRWEASGKKSIDTNNWHLSLSRLPVHLSDFKPERVLWHRPEATITDVGSGILNLEFHSKLNMMDQDALDGIDEIIQIASDGYQGIVVSNNGLNFTVGVNLGLLFMSAIEKDYQHITYMIESFQNRLMQLKYAPVPVVMACQGYTIGGGTEMLLHLNSKVVAHNFARVGLVEVNAGLIPGGGGSKELTLRAEPYVKERNWPKFISLFENIASGNINDTANEAKKSGILSYDAPVIANRDYLLHNAKKLCLSLSKGYKKPEATHVSVAGNEGITKLNDYIDSNKKNNHWSKKQVKLIKRAAYVFSGGNVAFNTLLPEQQLLSLEKETFLQLCGEQYTLKRINKILRGK
jgi:enoyl-CoA hydratase/carnithine racemase